MKFKYVDVVLLMFLFFMCVMEINFGVDICCFRFVVVNEYECIFFFENYLNVEKKKSYWRIYYCFIFMLCINGLIVFIKCYCYKLVF